MNKWRWGKPTNAHKGMTVKTPVNQKGEMLHNFKTQWNLFFRLENTLSILAHS